MGGRCGGSTHGARTGRDVPHRRCIGCGRIAQKGELVRIARADRAEGAQAVYDRDMRMPGRGAYLCRGAQPGQPLAACLNRALERRAIPRALRAAVSLDPKLVESVSR